MKEKNNIARLSYMVSALAKKGWFTTDEVKSQVKDHTRGIELSTRSIKRSVADLREFFGLKIKFDRSLKRYVLDNSSGDAERERYLIEELSRIKSSGSNSEELMLFYSFVKSLIFSEYYFPPVESRSTDGEIRDYEQILRIIERILKQELSENDIRLAGRIEYHLSEHYKLTKKIKFNQMLNILLESMRRELLVKFEYNKNNVTVEPVKIIHYEGKWYFMGYVTDSEKKDNLKKVRTYNLSYLEGNIHLTKQKFCGDDYDIPDYRDSFGIVSSSNIKTAVIRFYGSTASRMREILWFSGQRTTAGNDSRGEYTQFELPYPANTSFELIGRILRYGDRVEVKEPRELREQWKDEILKMYYRIKDH